MKKIRILFVSRSLGPAFGGMQSYARTFIRAMEKTDEISLKVVGYSGGRMGLGLFLVRAFFSCIFFRGDRIHLGDAVLSPLLPLLKWVRPGLKLSITVYGLDLIYQPALYQKMLKTCLPYAQRVAAISKATAETAKKFGLNPAVITVIPCATPNQNDIETSKPQNIRILICGRQIKRKGTVWFLKEVYPLLKRKIDDFSLTVAGAGPELPEIRSIAKGISGITVLGEVSEETREKLLDQSTLFLVPNIPVEGDMEGFGIVCIEAAARGVPTVAAGLEGLKDSVIEGETGLFFQPLDAVNASEIIQKAIDKKWDPGIIRSVCRQHFSDEKLASGYLGQIFLK